MTDRIAMIRDQLTQAFAPQHLEIEDESHLHAGHVGARDGGGHFVVTIVADAFRGKAPLACHRMVYDVLDELMKKDIHALSIKASAPQGR